MAKSLSFFLLLSFVCTFVFVKQSISSEKVEKLDPPFIKLELLGDKNVYILGSIHPISPQIALNVSAFEFLTGKELLSLESTAVIIEHDSALCLLLLKIERD